MEEGTRPRRGVARALPWVFGFVALAAACYPSGVNNVTDLNTVTTLYDQALASSGGYQALTTYSLAGATVANPSNCAIEDLADGGSFNFTNPQIPTAICNTINTELQDVGYTLINPTPTAPSFIVTVAALNQSYTAWVYYPWYGYWGGYYPGYPWYGWGIYYPWAGVGYSYQVGTLVISMVTPKADTSLADGGVINAIWAGALNGVNTPPNNTPQVISSGIVQAFNQSPYLGAASTR